MEQRYKPVAAALPEGAVCEVGSGPHGLARWTTHEVLGIDPGDDERHGEYSAPPNLRLLKADGVAIPLPDRSVAAAVAVDTFEHIPAASRASVVAEMVRVTDDGGRLILMGPTGLAAAEADAYVLQRWRERDPTSGIVTWLTEHEEIGLPRDDELADLLQESPRVLKVSSRGVYNISLWRTMHRALLGDFWLPPGERYVHHLMWAPFGALARRYRRRPFYRTLVIADLA